MKQMSIKKNCLDTNYNFFPPFLHAVLGVVNILVTLLALADTSPTAFSADLVFVSCNFA